MEFVETIWKSKRILQAEELERKRQKELKNKQKEEKQVQIEHEVIEILQEEVQNDLYEYLDDQKKISNERITKDDDEDIIRNQQELILNDQKIVQDEREKIQNDKEKTPNDDNKIQNDKKVISIENEEKEKLDNQQEEMVQPEKNQNIAIEILPAPSIQTLEYYYKHIFPKNEICQWLSCNNEYPLERRELMFSYHPPTSPEGELVATRGRIITNPDDLLSQLVAHPTVKIDVGSIYNKMAKRKSEDERSESAEEYGIVAKELVININLSDYDRVRTCCKKANICNKCWKYAAIACYILNKELKNYWQFKHILWVYSGESGLHGWVCDRKARKCSIKERQSIIYFFNSFLAGSKKKRVELSNYLHSLIRDNFEMCLEFFEDVCIKEQNLLNAKDDVLDFLHRVPKEFQTDLAFEFANLKTSLERWDRFLQYYKEKTNINSSLYKFLIDEIIVYYIFPRIDIPKSSELNQLQNCPFSMHPKTGNFVLVIDPPEADLLDVENPVKLDKLVEQHRHLDRSQPEPGSPLFIFQSSERLFNNFLKKIKSDP